MSDSFFLIKSNGGNFKFFCLFWITLLKGNYEYSKQTLLTYFARSMSQIFGIMNTNNNLELILLYKVLDLVHYYRIKKLY